MGMFFERVRSEHLGHISYIFGHGGRAAVIDPRRDCRRYVEIARANGASISHIFETHRNEDYISGAVELARRTGARILHGAGLPFTFGEPVREGDSFRLGDLKLKVLETPGHTFESISLALYDESAGSKAVGVFTGDCLFIGDVGRTDFFPGRDEEVAGLLWSSIFEKLLPLGDHVLLWPAHGAGSVCGSGMSERELSSLGYERLHNPALQRRSREEFVAAKLRERHPKPAYFKRMEEFNLHGSAPPLAGAPLPPPLSPNEFEERMDAGMICLDLRSPEAVAGACIPSCLAVPLDMLPGWAGHFLPYNHNLGLVVECESLVETAVRYLLRLGYDRVAGFLGGGMPAWETAGKGYDRIPALHVRELTRRVEHEDPFTLLDVRWKSELLQGRIPRSLHIPLDELPLRLGEVPREGTVTTFCGSGRRAIIAASILKRAGFRDVEDSLGSMAACRAFGCPLEPPEGAQARTS